jgi:hypothetical protein
MRFTMPVVVTKLRLKNPKYHDELLMGGESMGIMLVLERRRRVLG